jgi:preprotein translocase subunit SecA
VDLGSIDLQTADREEIAHVLSDDVGAAYERREGELGEELMRFLERQILLQIIDNRWREHLFEMDYLREGIHLRGFAQIDPLVAYKNEGFQMFSGLMNSIWEEFARIIFHVQVNIEPAEFEPESEPEPAAVRYSGGGPEQPSALEQAAGAAPATGAAVAGAAAPAGVSPAAGDGHAGDGVNPETRVKAEHEKIGRNDPCWCGSGKKYKKCHGA